MNDQTLCGGLHWAQIMARDVKRKLMVMPSNNSSAIVHFWAGRYDGRTGWMQGTENGRQAKALGHWLAGKALPHSELGLAV